jgi:protein arginine N-methyltransferase 5
VLSPPQPVFTFEHPNRAAKIDNSRAISLRFERPAEDGASLLHGFAGARRPPAAAPPISSCCLGPWAQLAPPQLHRRGSRPLSPTCAPAQATCPSLPPTHPPAAGYFDTTLYEDVMLSTHPATHTPDMSSWFPIYFPLKEPRRLAPGQAVELSMWRCCTPHKVWYEWAVTQPAASHIHNVSGRSYYVGL